MKQHKHLWAAILAGSLAALAGTAQADQDESYGEAVGRKLGSGLANMTMSTLELPKNIVIDTNQGNIFYGVAGGVIEGVLHSLGRVGAGALDFLSAPFPTKPSVYPLYVWEKMDTKTSYGPILRPSNPE